MFQFRRQLKILALLFVLLIALTWNMNQPVVAYYTTVGTATNVVTSGSIELVIHETTSDGSAFPEEGVVVLPGDIISKVVKIENHCNHPFWLRVKLVDGVTSEQLSSEECFDIAINQYRWTLREDGWLYYDEPLEPGQFSAPVFEEVRIVGEKVDNSYIGETLLLTVSAQAVQSENNPAEHPWEVSGWPAE